MLIYHNNFVQISEQNDKSLYIDNTLLNKLVMTRQYSYALLSLINVSAEYFSVLVY